ncbi:MAG: DMT family transporter, partial [Myxococcota bacterium]
GNLSRRVQRVGSTVLTARAITLSIVFVLPIAMFFSAPPSSPSAIQWGALAYSGLGATAVGYGLRYWLIKREGYTFVSFLGYLMPPLSGFWGFVLLGETLPWKMWLAGVGALLGLYVSRSKPARPSR